MRPRVAAVSMLALALGRVTAWVDPVEDFYRGRTVTLVIGYSAAIQPRTRTARAGANILSRLY